MKNLLVFLFATLACATASWAQKWEVGVGVGGAFYNSQTFTNAVGKADATLNNGLVAGAWFGNNSSSHLGGEFRYEYENTDLKLSSGSVRASFGAVTHAFHYDLVWHFTSSESGIRPFVAAGGGIKMFRGTGVEAPFQPLSTIGLLTKTSQITPLISVGGGVKFRLGTRLQLRLEAHDFLTPFPSKVIAPALGSKTSGWLMDFVPMGALAYTF